MAFESDVLGSYIPPKLSIFEKLNLGLKLIHVLVTSPILSYLTYPFSTNSTLSLHLQRRKLRTFLDLVTDRQLHALTKTTSSQLHQDYPTGAVSTYFSPGCPSVRVFWTPNPPTEGQHVILYVHGGGFQLPLSYGHTRYLRYAAPPNTAIGVLEYPLTPNPAAVYPAPFRTAAVALNGLLASDIPASKITFAGDSAGGHIGLSVLSHMLHPHPDVPRIDLRGDRLAAIIAISPCVRTATTSASMARYAGTDLIWPELVERWTTMAIPPERRLAELNSEGYWSEAGLAPASWWEGSGEVCKRMLVTAGSHEIFVDDIVAWWEIFKNAVKGGRGGEEVMTMTRTELVIAEGETHDTPLLDFEVQRGVSEVSKRVKDWFAELAVKVMRG